MCTEIYSTYFANKKILAGNFISILVLIIILITATKTGVKKDILILTIFLLLTFNDHCNNLSMRENINTDTGKCPLILMKRI